MYRVVYALLLQRSRPVPRPPLRHLHGVCGVPRVALEALFERRQHRLVVHRRLPLLRQRAHLKPSPPPRQAPQPDHNGDVREVCGMLVKIPRASLEENRNIRCRSGKGQSRVVRPERAFGRARQACVRTAANATLSHSEVNTSVSSRSAAPPNPTDRRVSSS